MTRTAAKTDCPRLILDITSAQRRRIKVAASAQDDSVYAYFSRLLDRTVPSDPGAMEPLRPVPYIASLLVLAGQGAPLPEGSADLIRSASWSESILVSQGRPVPEYIRRQTLGAGTFCVAH
jgi:hypothetical protein